ncbi:MAG TPA: arylsulfatase [Gemmataceae bacterium]|nr:arylsulfatase [Gemmataceae bacterium]
MFRRSNLPVLVALMVGAAGGWAGASGRLDSLLKGEQKAAAAADPAPCPLSGTAGECCANPDKATALAAVAAHNERVAANLQKDGKKPNILIIWGDDIGWFNPSCYHGGVMGYQTPNIDRIAREGARFTDWYGQQSCTAGRAAFITGQSPIRTGMTKVGLPGSTLGLQPEDPTIAELLKPQGYVCGQFGKNHLGDRNEFLPTVHGFDEFFGNLYHLNAEEEPENPDYPKNPEFKKKFGPRGVLHSWATDKDDPTVDPQFGKVGKQRIENTGALTTKRMETVDEEFLDGALKFIEKSHQDGKPFFCWFNSTRMHVFTHLKQESKGKTGLGTYPDGMVEHDGMVGQLLKKLDDLGIADNTLVMWSTDNGAEVFSWPDGGTTPFRGEKDTNWEGGWRVPCVIRWPGVIKPGTVSSEICAHEDMLPTILAAAGDPNIVEKCLKGHKAGDRTYKVHLDGYNLIPALKGEAKEWPRKEMLYWSDDGDLMALRYEQWKIHFVEQRAESFKVWSEPFVKLRVPLIFNLRADPFEKAQHNSINYADWMFHRAFLLVPAQAYVAKWIESFKDFPPRQKPASFSIDEVMRKLEEGPRGK